MAGKSLQQMTEAELEAELAQIEGASAVPREARDPMAAAAVETAGASVDPGVAAIMQLAAPVASPAAGAAAAVKRAIYPESAAEGIKEENEKLPDWSRMPELWDSSIQARMAKLGTIATGGEETVKILQAQFPELKARHDGRYIVFTSRDGNEYAWKPGFRLSDLARAGVGMAIGAPIAMAAPAGMMGGAIAGAAGAALNEGMQWLGGGTFDKEQLLYGAGAGALVPAASAAGRVITGSGAEAAAQRGAQAAAAQTFEEGTAMLGRASQGSAGDKAALRGFLDPDQGFVDAMGEIGAGELVDAGAAAKNAVAREVLKGAAGTGEGAILREISDDKTLKLIDHLKGMFSEWSGELAARGAVSSSLKERMKNGVGALTLKTNQAFQIVRDAISNESGSANNAINLLKKRAPQGNVSKLPTPEQYVMAELADNPTYRSLELLQERLRAAGKGQADPALAGLNRDIARKLEGAVKADILETASAHGQGQMLEAARALSKQEATLKSAFTARFGKQLKETINGAMVPKGATAAREAAIGGDVSKLVGLYETLPASMRAEALVDEFGQILRKTGDLKALAGLFDAVDSVPQLRGIFTDSIKPEVRKGLENVAKIARRYARFAEAPSYPNRIAAALPDVEPGFGQMASAKVAKWTENWRGKEIEKNKLKVMTQFLVDEASSLIEGRPPSPSLFRRVMDAGDVPEHERGKWFDVLRTAPAAAPRRDKEKR